MNTQCVPVFLLYVMVFFIDALCRIQATGFQYYEEFFLLIKATSRQNEIFEAPELGLYLTNLQGPDGDKFYSTLQDIGYLTVETGGKANAKAAI